ncbi:MAG TPA: adenylate/guanylate cyclase domain-containing protein [Lacunisphaera sp.]|nr:adenylate/guanylate cyclase domain-containing protein [Lacunisphaera sp.]
MDATPPFPVVSTQRQLAVIMFTDAVGYSAKMHEQELATLNRIERDTEVMRRHFGEHSGTVLKSTGDGLLVQFVSAVEAVACALAIQRFFAANRSDPTHTQSALRHRIGIHLGDVFVGNGDAMGDGVNIAARLVTQSQPGGIVISQTVYDVVKNKLPLNVQRFGPQKLKNISEPLTLYRVLLDDNPRPAPAVAAKPANVPVPPAPPERRSRRPLVLGLLVFVPGLFFLGRFLLQQQAAHEEEMSRNQSAREALGAELQKNAAETAATPDRPAGRDFARLVTRTPVINSSAVEGAATRLAAEDSAAKLIAWMSTDLMRYTKDRPLLVEGLGDVARTTVYLDAQNRLNFLEGGATRRMAWADMRPTLQAAVIVSALQHSPSPVPPAVRLGADAFAYLHGLPDMVTALPR